MSPPVSVFFTEEAGSVTPGTPLPLLLLLLLVLVGEDEGA